MFLCLNIIGLRPPSLTTTLARLACLLFLQRFCTCTKFNNNITMQQETNNQLLYNFKIYFIST